MFLWESKASFYVVSTLNVFGTHERMRSLKDKIVASHAAVLDLKWNSLVVSGSAVGKCDLPSGEVLWATESFFIICIVSEHQIFLLRTQICFIVIQGQIVLCHVWINCFNWSLWRRGLQDQMFCLFFSPFGRQPLKLSLWSHGGVLPDSRSAEKCISRWHQKIVSFIFGLTYCRLCQCFKSLYTIYKH